MIRFILNMAEKKIAYHKTIKCLCIIIVNLLVICFGVEDKYFIGFSEETGRLYTRDAVIVTAITETEKLDYDPNARKSNRKFGLPCVTWEGVKGVCSRYQECFPDETKHDIDIGNTCYEEETKRYGVCCTKKIKHDSTMRLNDKTTRQGHFQNDNLTVFSQNAEHENNNISVILENLQELQTTGRGGEGLKCGGVKREKNKYGRIVGGQKSERGKWPWVIVFIKDQHQYCGGALITNRYALTAAHCTRTLTASDLKELRTNLGEFDFKSSDHFVAEVKKAISHKEFTTEFMLSDIAIITFRRKVPFNKFIEPICLPNPQKSYAKTTGMIVGWGRLWEDGPLPLVLQEVSLKVWSNRDCRIRFGPVAPAGIVDSMICAGGQGKDACSGDSGGPLMVKDGSTWIAAGIVSWGFGCGSTEYPGVYTRVASYLSWIKANLRK